MTPRSVALQITFALAVLFFPSQLFACNLPSELSRVVVKVPNADTLLLDDGSEVVLIGAMPPASLGETSPSQTIVWSPAETTRKHLEALVGGKAVDLAFSGRRLDRYGRQLAHVFLNQQTVLNQTQTREWVQGNLLAHGLARTYALPGSTACFDDLLASENHARANQAGHWGTAVFQDRSAHDPRELARYRDTFQVIQGRIDHTAKVRGQLVFDFSPAGRTGFSLWIAPPSGSRGKKPAISAQDFAGKNVRVRGWIEQRRGPRLTLETLSQIEVLNDLPASSSLDTAPNPEDTVTGSVPAAIPATHQ